MRKHFIDHQPLQRNDGVELSTNIGPNGLLQLKSAWEKGAEAREKKSE
jgi:hypothetical protein